MMTENRYGSGVVLVLAGLFALACMDALSKELGQRYSVVQILWLRFLVFIVFAVIVSRPSRLRATIQSSQPMLQVLRSLILLVEIGIIVVTLRYLPLAETHAILSISPLIVTAMAVLFLGERVGPSLWVAVVVAFVGVLIILRPGTDVFGRAALLPLVGTLLWASYQILTRRLARDDTAETALLYMALTGVVVLTGLGPFFWIWPTPVDWLLLIALAGLGSVGHLAIIKALQIAPASFLQPFSYSLLLWATVVGFVVFGDMPDQLTVIGAGIVVASGLFAAWRERSANVMSPSRNSEAT